MEYADRQTDRYKSFKGIDCEGNARRLITMLRYHIDNPEKSNLFWEKFKMTLDKTTNCSPGTEIRMDNLFLIHSYINTIRELFEENEDKEALRLLDKIEAECC